MIAPARRRPTTRPTTRRRAISRAPVIAPMLVPAPLSRKATPEERGFKDTVKVNPGDFTTIRGRFDLPSGVTAPQSYVHHCHIVEHEDNDMMETFVVSP
jgi:spore coat protein A